MSKTSAWLFGSVLSSRCIEVKYSHFFSQNCNQPSNYIIFVCFYETQVEKTSFFSFQSLDVIFFQELNSLFLLIFSQFCDTSNFVFGISFGRIGFHSMGGLGLGMENYIKTGKHFRNYTSQHPLINFCNCH